MSKSATGARRSPFRNPFFALLIVLSTAFVVTAIAYWVGPMIALKAKEDPRLASDNPATPHMVAWLDRYAPTLLTIQFVGMAILAVAAMSTDSWFDRPRGKPAQARTPGSGI